VYQRRRDLAIQMLQDLGWAAETPQAALYIWFQIPPGYTSSADFCLALIERTGVSLTPGSDFGPHGEGYRLSINKPDEILRKLCPSSQL
jgi:LL-diaminopimelate aminotransferase